jgi:hypothetical protein
VASREYSRGGLVDVLRVRATGEDTWIMKAVRDSMLCMPSHLVFLHIPYPLALHTVVTVERACT